MFDRAISAPFSSTVSGMSNAHGSSARYGSGAGSCGSPGTRRSVSSSSGTTHREIEVENDLPRNGPSGWYSHAWMSRADQSFTSTMPNTRYLYWSIAQQIAHLTVNGASLRTGDLLATGTISGPERSERGSLIELSWNGEEPIELPDGSTRTFLEDGDEVVLRGDPLGEVRGRIEPAISR